MAVPGKMEMNLFQLSCFRRRISNKNCWLILHESPEVLVTLRFSVMKNFWFSIPWAPTVLEHSGGWSTSALYPCATKGRECIALASKLPSPLEINGLRSRLKPISEGHPLSTWTKRKYSSFWRPWNGVNKQEGSRREHVFTTRKFLKWSLMCVLCNSAPSSLPMQLPMQPCLLPNSENSTVIRSYEGDMLRLTLVSPATSYTSAINPFYVHYSRFVSAARRQLCLPRQ